MNLLTGIKETDMEIMLRLNPYDIEKFSYINKNAMTIANDLNFWKLKFEYDDLPMLAYQDNMKNWIKDYVLIYNITNMVNLILDIHRIESKRKKDPLNMIRISLDNTYDIIKTIFPGIRRHTEEEFTNLIIILDKSYKMIVEWIVMETGERETVEMETDRETIFDIMVKILYKHDEEVLDQLSIPFIIGNANLNYYDEDDKKIIYKRLGIIDALLY